MKKVISILLTALMVMTAVIFTGCTKSSDSKSSGDKPIIAVSIVPEATFAEAVCGDLAEVITMVPPGSSPETYEPTPQEMEKFSKSSLFFAIGVPVEEASIIPGAGDVTVISLQDKVSKVYPDRTFEGGERDPHIWLSPKRAKIMVQTIADEVSKIDSDNKDTYQKNAADYTAKLDQLDKDISAELKGVKNKSFIVYHPAFGYLADDYGLKMYSLEEEGKESTPQHLQEMIDLAKKENVKAIFYQEEIDSSQSEAFAEELGGKTIQLSPLAAEYIDNLKKMAQTIAEAVN